MAARLPVVVSQSVRREPQAVSCEENLITELMFTPGLDATLIGPLETIASGSTDHLCLEGFKGPFSLLSWVSANDCRQQLSRLGISGMIFDHDSGVSSGIPIENSIAHETNNTRRIEFFQLRTDAKPSKWIELLKQRLEVREVKAFQIQLSGKALTLPTVPLAAATSVTKDELPSSRPPLVPLIHSQRVEKSIAKLERVDLDCDDEAWVHLDTLMEDLDRADV